MWAYNSYTELYHHGIRGQRWGVRRFQNEDGSLTDAGRKRYDVDIDGANSKYEKAKANYAKAAKKMNSYPSQSTLKAYSDAKKQLAWAKKDLQDEKIKEKLNNETKKSEHRLKLEEHYKQKGMSPEEAEIAAYKRARVEKALVAVGAVSVAAAAAYVGKKEYDKRVDRILDSGTLLSRISTNDNVGVQDAFYAAYKKGDVKKYAGYLADTRYQQGAKGVFQKSIKLNNGLKIASDKHALEALRDTVSKTANGRQELKKALYENNQFVKAYGTDKQRKTFEKAIRAIDNGKINDDVYKAFNLTNAGGGSSLVKSFYGTLKSRGYDAISDINDKKLSDYKTKDPIIVINAAKAVVDKVRQVSRDESGSTAAALANSEAGRDTLARFGKRLFAAGGAAGAISAATKAKNSKSQDRIVREYRKLHPNTELSYYEILRARRP